MPAVVLFDVNETLVDLAALDEPFEEVFGDAAVREVWFGALLHTALRVTAMDAYEPFSKIAAAVLDDVAAREGRSLDGEARDAILDGLRRLPAHPDVAPALERLGEAGYRRAALTNSGPEAARQKLRYAGLARYFDAVFSAAESGRLKPAPAPYERAARRLDAAPSDCWFVAAHDWDIAGAARAGYRTAFVAREGKRLGPLAGVPTVRGPDLETVSERIIEQDE